MKYWKLNTTQLRCRTILRTAWGGHIQLSSNSNSLLSVECAPQATITSEKVYSTYTVTLKRVGSGSTEEVLLHEVIELDYEDLPCAHPVHTKISKIANGRHRGETMIIMTTTCTLTEDVRHAHDVPDYIIKNYQVQQAIQPT